MQKIGLLLPRSTYYETISFDIFQGLKSGLENFKNKEYKIITENIGFGADKQQCYRAAEKLLLEENVSIVVAYIGHRTAELLRPLFLAANKILVVLDAGANLPNEWPSCPNIFYHSLHNALGARLTAQKAVNDGFNEGALITGYYDGGYLHTYSISKSFEDFNGKIVFNHATGYKTEDFSMEPLQSHLNTYPNTALLSLFSGDFVQWYFKEIEKYFKNDNIPIYLTPFGMEESTLEEAVFPSNNVKGIISWSKKINNQENKTFIETLETSGRKPNMFSLISWESVSIVDKIIDLLDIHKNNLVEISTELKKFEFDSPRGTISFDVKTNTTLSPLFEAKLIKKNGFCEIEIEKSIPNYKEEFEKLASFELENINSAWYNSYTCI
ncbi:ABC transporter substrate-binding protein [Flavobacterium sediminilitoris]|uniref:ABC transporter substrate-binding protein n=1 Tax=Flavobacterium sediminilitoris TaxID=2024526 RepID=A0ABY4HIP6_9FLAO|nr:MULTISPECIES: ABC transporter substrate-binding protein [Flavobacterium]UOX32568.1 ABC transporter substrate-binding protein [Flavobacterium sediminilitoris]